MSEQSDEQKKRWGLSGVAIPGGLFIGIGCGILVDNVAAGVLIGLGVGFLVMMAGMIFLQKKGE